MNGIFSISSTYMPISSYHWENKNGFKVAESTKPVQHIRVHNNCCTQSMQLNYIGLIKISHACTSRTAQVIGERKYHIFESGFSVHFTAPMSENNPEMLNK